MFIQSFFFACAWLCVYMCVSICMCTHVCACTYLHVYTCVSMCVPCVFVCVLHVCVYVCVCMCVHVHGYKCGSRIPIALASLSVVRPGSLSLPMLQALPQSCELLLSTYSSHRGNVFFTMFRILLARPMKEAGLLKILNQCDTW